MAGRVRRQELWGGLALSKVWCPVPSPPAISQTSWPRAGRPQVYTEYFYVISLSSLAVKIFLCKLATACTLGPESFVIGTARSQFPSLYRR
jgi:hypothetical protein